MPAKGSNHIFALFCSAKGSNHIFALFCSFIRAFSLLQVGERPLGAHLHILSKTFASFVLFCGQKTPPIRFQFFSVSSACSCSNAPLVAVGRPAPSRLCDFALKSFSSKSAETVAQFVFGCGWPPCGQRASLCPASPRPARNNLLDKEPLWRLTEKPAGWRAQPEHAQRASC